jgi:hypothetical protein
MAESSAPGAPTTCGEGLAANANVPAQLAALLAATADLLEAHRDALDADDPSSLLELAAYRDLVDQHRRAAADLVALSERMSSYRDIPDGIHDMTAMASQAPAFERYVARERELAALLTKRIADDMRMLAEDMGT